MPVLVTRRDGTVVEVWGRAEKPCTKCGVVKAVTDFPIQEGKTEGKFYAIGKCKACIAEKMAKKLPAVKWCPGCQRPKERSFFGGERGTNPVCKPCETRLGDW